MNPVVIPEILENLLHYPGPGTGELLIVVAHDITLFPGIYRLSGENMKSIEFLSGIVISADMNITDEKHSFKTGQMIS